MTGQRVTGMRLELTGDGESTSTEIVHGMGLSNQEIAACFPLIGIATVRGPVFVFEINERKSNSIVFKHEQLGKDVLLVIHIQRPSTVSAAEIGGYA